MPGAPELSGRALAGGTLLGAALCTGNVYLALMTGWIDTGNVPAVLIAATLQRTRARLAELELLTVQTTASAAACAVMTGGLSAAVPALAMLGRPVPLPWVAALAVLAGAFGTVLALRAYRPLVLEERLPFPTGYATADLIRSVAARQTGDRAILAAGALAASFTWLRDAVPRWIPGSAGAALGPGGLGTFALSPMLFGAGLLVGARTGVALLLGALVAWAGLAPAALARGLGAAPTFEALVVLLLWPGIGLLLGDTAVFVAVDLVRRRRPGDTPRAATGHVRLLVALAAALAAVGHLGVGLPIWAALALVAACPLLAMVSSRAAGATDILPITQMGQITQLGLGAVAPGQLPLNVAGGWITSAACAQTTVGLISLRAGERLGARPTRQALALLLGAVAGTLVAVPTYALLAGARGLGTAALPVPAATASRALAEAIAGGPSALPAGALGALGVGLAAGVALGVLRLAWRTGPWLPAAAVGIGFLTPPSYALVLAAGAFAGAALRKLRPGAGDVRLPAVASGLIAGEGILATLIAALRLAGALPP